MLPDFFHAGKEVRYLVYWLEMLWFIQTKKAWEDKGVQAIADQLKIKTYAPAS
jgi:hypothetical protein